MLRTAITLRPSIIATAVMATLPAWTSAQSLVDMYESARAYDAAYQSARNLFDANQTKAEQARAAILPTANLAGSAQRTQINVFPDLGGAAANVDRVFGAKSATVSASQPLYRPANLASYKQGIKQVELASAQWQAAEQDLLIRVSQAYFDVLGSQDSLTFVKAQKAAVAEQLTFAKRNFEVGTSTITATREAQARFLAYAPTSSQPIASKQVIEDLRQTILNSSNESLAMSPHYCGFRLKPSRFLFYAYRLDELSDVHEFNLKSGLWCEQLLSP